MLQEAEIEPSMSRVGKCIDNGPMESFWGTLKCEKYYLHKYKAFDELEQAIDDYIHFYNHERLQKRLNGLTPMEYKSKAALDPFYYYYCLLDRVQFRLNSRDSCFY